MKADLFSSTKGEKLSPLTIEFSMNGFLSKKRVTHSNKNVELPMRVPHLQEISIE